MHHRRRSASHCRSKCRQLVPRPLCPWRAVRSADRDIELTPADCRLRSSAGVRTEHARHDEYRSNLPMGIGWGCDRDERIMQGDDLVSCWQAVAACWQCFSQDLCFFSKKAVAWLVHEGSVAGPSLHEHGHGSLSGNLFPNVMSIFGTCRYSRSCNFSFLREFQPRRYCNRSQVPP